jgi:hypothetical protein
VTALRQKGVDARLVERRQAVTFMQGADEGRRRQKDS